MSIINDALKKAKNKQPTQGDAPQILPEIEKGSPGPVSRRWLIWIGAGALCVAGFFLVMNSFRGRSEHQTALSEPSRSVFNIREIDFEMPFRTSDFRLTGIIYDDENPMAIINNRILEEGALINGAELLEIQPHHVMLSFKGKEIKLKVK